MERFVSPLLELFTGFSASAPDVDERPEWRRHFDAAGAPGAFALFEPAKDRYVVLDASRARQRFVPASTFEIAIALAGIEVGAIDDENEIFRWDGRPKTRAAWERDHTLATAMREGVAWMFQEVARRIGRERMREWLDRLEYGNCDMKGGIDLFWLQGALRVSAMEQVDFLRRLAEGELPMTQRAQRLVRAALVVEKTAAHTLYAKSGGAGAAKNAVDWSIGWVERKGRPAAYFALDFPPGARLGAGDRLAIARSILGEAGISGGTRAPS